MKLPLLFFTFVLVTVPTAAGDCIANHNWEDGCEVDGNIGQYTCPKDGTCTNPDAVDAGLEVEACPYAEMNATKCSELCDLSKGSDTVSDEDHRCRFWRYDDLYATDQKRCTLLKSCDIFYYCDPTHCQCGDVGCKGDVPATNEAPCKAETVFNPSADHKDTTYIRWSCLSGNPYNTDPIPAGTPCWTTHKCHKWEADERRELRVTCDGAGDLGHWTASIPAGMEDFYATALGADGSDALVELDCGPKDDPEDMLSVNVEATGGLITCENPDNSGSADYRIKAPNKCLLLCDFHLGMTIEGFLDDEGNYIFMKMETDEIIETDQDILDKIKCWPTPAE